MAMKKMKDRRYYLGLRLENGYYQHQIITPIGFHWRTACISMEKNGVQVDRFLIAYSMRAPEVCIPYAVVSALLKESCR